MNKEYLKALEEIRDFRYGKDKLLVCQTEMYHIIEQALQRLESIDNAEPSEALKSLNKIVESFNETTTGMYGLGEVVVANDLIYGFKKELDTIKQYILKAQEQEKIFDDKLLFRDGSITCGFDYKGKSVVAMPLIEYNKFMEQDKMLEIIKEKVMNLVHIEDGCVWDNELYQSNGLTQEEFELLKRYVE